MKSIEKISRELLKSLSRIVDREEREWYVKKPKAFINFVHIARFVDQVALVPVVAIVKRWNFDKEVENGDLTTYEYEYRLAFMWLNWGISFRIFRKKEK